MSCGGCAVSCARVTDNNVHSRPRPREKLDKGEKMTVRIFELHSIKAGEAKLNASGGWNESAFSFRAQYSRS